MKALLLFFSLLFMYKDQRQVILFYNNDGIELRNKQMALLNADTKGWMDRDIVIHTYETGKAKEAAGKWNVSPNTAFTFILIGKDGGEKMRTDTVVSLAQLYKTIDAMPMRRSEMNKKKGEL